MKLSRWKWLEEVTGIAALYQGTWQLVETVRTRY
jgi:hypothetical protein